MHIFLLIFSLTLPTEDFMEEGSIMLRRRFVLFVVLAGLLVGLSACGTQGSPQPTQPSDQLWSEDQFGSYLQTVGSQSSLSSVSGNSALAALAAIPSGSPMGDLSALANPDALQSSDAAAGLLQGLALSAVYAPTNNGGSALPLPTGIWEYDKFKNKWSYLGNSDYLVVKFYWGNLPYNGTYTYMTLSADWDAHGATTTATRGGVSYEVPTGLKISVNKDGIDAGYVSLYADWYKACNGVTQLEPQKLAIKGDFAHTGGDVAVDFEVNISRHEGGSHLAANNNSGCSCAGDKAVTIKSDGYVRVAFDGSGLLQAANNTDSKDDLAKVTWNNVFYGKETRDADCQWQDLKIKNGEVDLGVKFKLNGKQDTLQLRSTFDNIVKDQNGIISVDLDGKIKVNDEIAVLFEGTLDSSTQNLKLTFSKTGASLAEFAGKYLSGIELPSFDFLAGLGLNDLPSLPF
jgi:hypothetical protein